MDKEEIKNKLSQKYNEFTTNILTNSIFEYQELFKQKYYNTDEVIEIVIKNMPKGIVLYDNKEGIYDATCAISSGEFKVEKKVLNEKEYFKYVFFHEFLHAISYRKHNNMQFMGFYTIEKGEDYKFKSEFFNEAFTEFMTLKRNRICNYEPENKDLSGYDVGANKLELLTKIIPEEELIDCYFNCPNKLEEIFKKYRMNIDEIFFSFYALEEKEYDVHSLEKRSALHRVQDLFKIIDGERYLFYNLSESFGEIKSKEKFLYKWSILLSEENSKYNFYNIDGILRYGELCDDIDNLKIENDTLNKIQISTEKINKYKLLNVIFNPDDKMKTLNELYKIYSKNYKEYWDLIKDDFAILAYTFLDNIKNNYELYDIEIYPRVYPYLEKENAKIEDVNFEKIICEEERIKFFIFKIKDNIYIEANYDDTKVEKISKDEYEVKYGNEKAILNIKNNTYEINNIKYNVKKIY